jgi:hypothetical protein
MYRKHRQRSLEDIVFWFHLVREQKIRFQKLFQAYEVSYIHRVVPILNLNFYNFHFKGIYNNMKALITLEDATNNPPFTM